MLQKGSNSKCNRRSKTSNCSFENSRKAEQACSPKTTFNELQNEIERDLQNSERVLFAANNCRGNTSRNCSGKRTNGPHGPHGPHASHDKMEASTAQGFPESFLRNQQTPGKRTPSRVPKPSPNRNMHSSNEHHPESHKLEIKNFSQNESSHHEHDHYHESREEIPKLDEKSLKSIYHLSKLKRSSSDKTCEFDQGLDFFEICCPKVNEEQRVVKLPEVPHLLKEHIEELIKCETRDVESAWYLTSEEKRTYKKPCPKQQKAQMRVKALVEASRKSSQPCGKKYSPLESPEPEDISPETAAAMMFLQEQGVKMEGCPNATITRLFPDEPRSAFPNESGVSVIDPNRDDQKDMIERSASVPAEGVSDSAYTRRMAGKADDLGPQRSYDVELAIDQSKREYVFVTRKPQRVNMVRFRGGSTPSWFPWYLSAFPDDEEGLKLETSPSGLFYKAWLHSNPENIPANDVIVLD